MKDSDRAAISSLVVSVALFAQAAQAFYSPETGRWLSRDPLGEAGGLALHSFVRNDPVARTDFLGLSKDHDNCLKQLSDYLQRLHEPASAISQFWKKTTAGLENCPVPPMSCACCDSAKRGGEYDPNEKAITIC